MYSGRIAWGASHPRNDLRPTDRPTDRPSARPPVRPPPRSRSGQACLQRALAATFDLMTQRTPLVRSVGLLALAAFLLAQSWMVCAPLCLLQGHARVALAASQFEGHVMHCHSDNVVLSQLPTGQSLGNMLPTRVAAPLLPFRVVAVCFIPPAPIHLQQVPPADPPPPRPV
jgi:hypothetical protein